MIIFSMWCPFSVTFHYCSAKSLKQWLYLVSEVSCTGQAEIKAPHKQNRKAIGFSPLPCFTRGHWLVTFKTRQTGTTQTITPHLEREKLDMFLCSACFMLFESRQMHTEIDGQVSACVCVCVCLYTIAPQRRNIQAEHTHISHSPPLHLVHPSMSLLLWKMVSPGRVCVSVNPSSLWLLIEIN